MPIRLEDLPAPPSELIADDRTCAGCGYSLNGLRTDGKCPECGRPIRRPRTEARFGDQMVQAPLGWLRGYARATLLLGLGGWTLALSVLAWTWTLSWIAGVTALAGAAAWTAGVFLSTRPRPRTKMTVVDPRQEWVVMRLWARVSQPAWIFAVLITLAAQAAEKSDTWIIAPIVACVLVGVVGWWPLMIVQSNLAYWASDTDLAGKLRNSPWIVVIGQGLGMMVLYVIGQGWCAGMLGSVLFFGAWAGMILFSLGYVLASLWQLWRMAHWVTLNHIGNDMRDERLRRRATRAVPPKGAK